MMNLPRLALGTFQLQNTQEIVYDAIKIGYRHIDTAAVYRNEEQVGKACKQAISEGIVSRQDLFITTKIAPKDQGYEKATSAIMNSVIKLDMEYIDLVLVHWPGTQKLKPDNPKNKENRIGTLKALSESKFIRQFGVSNFMIKHFDGLTVNPSVNQIEFHPLLWTSEMKTLLDYCASRNIVIGAYSCLGQGELLDQNAYPEIDTVAKRHDYTMAQVLIQWAMSKGCIVMPKASSVARLQENFAAATIQLSTQDCELIESIVVRTGKKKFCWDPESIY